MFTRPGDFAVVLPVKSPGLAKSRLATLPDQDRAALAVAFATDVVVACLRTTGVAGVLVVSDDAEFASSLGSLGAATAVDPGDGLNSALRHGAAVLAGVRPDVQPVALLGDLPALAPDDLATALEDARTSAGEACFVRDADATGTTLYTAAPGRFAPAFGPNSAAAHASAGARPLSGPLLTLRRDVDDVAALRAAIELGVGSITSAALDLMARRLR